MQVSILQKRIKKQRKKPRYTIRERLFVLWHMETFQIPRRKITEHLGVSRSTLYRWLHQIDNTSHTLIPASKTPLEIAVLVWEITKSNIDWGRVRIANQLALLNIFIAASTVRNMLNRPKPRKPGFPVASTKTEERTGSRSIPAWYPNHVWSIDTTEVLCWGLWLKRVSFIRGFDHLVTLCEEFEDWYNTWRPHMTLDGFRPDDVYYDRKSKKPHRDSKTVPRNIQQHLFRQTRVAGYRLKDVA